MVTETSIKSTKFCILAESDPEMVSINIILISTDSLIV